MADWKTRVNIIKGFLKTYILSTIRINKAKQKPNNGAKKRKRNLTFFLKITKKYYEQKRFPKARQAVKSGLKNFPKQIDLLIIATDIFRASGDREKSLEYSEMLITHHPDNWNGYGRASQDLIALKRYEEARTIVRIGLSKFPNQVDILKSAGKLNLISMTRGRPILLHSPVPIFDIDICQYALPTIQSLDSICKTLSRQINAVAEDIKPFMQHSASFLIFKDCIVSDAPGLHHFSGIPFNHSVPTRGRLNFPEGFYAQILPSALNSISSQAVGFYIPYINFDFGHYLTETASSLSHLLFLRRSGIALPTSYPIIIPDGDPYRIARILNVNPSQVVNKSRIKSQLAFKYVIAPMPTIINRRFTSRLHQDVVKLLIKYDHNISAVNFYKCDEKYRKVYISRSRLAPNKRLLEGELLLENFLEHNGWFVYHPQEYNLEDQIKTYQQAEFICSQVGSAIHCLFAIDSSRLKKFILLENNSPNNFTRQLESQNIIYTRINCLRSDPKCTKWGPLKNIVLRAEFTFERLALEIEEQTLC